MLDKTTIDRVRRTRLANAKAERTAAYRKLAAAFNRGADRRTMTVLARLVERAHREASSIERVMLAN
jgi:hypothetical protein